MIFKILILVLKMIQAIEEISIFSSIFFFFLEGLTLKLNYSSNPLECVTCSLRFNSIPIKPLCLFLQNTLARLLEAAKKMAKHHSIANMKMPLKVLTSNSNPSKQTMVQIKVVFPKLHYLVGMKAHNYIHKTKT